MCVRAGLCSPEGTSAASLLSRTFKIFFEARAGEAARSFRSMLGNVLGGEGDRPALFAFRSTAGHWRTALESLVLPAQTIMMSLSRDNARGQSGHTMTLVSSMHICDHAMINV